MKFISDIVENLKESEDSVSNLELLNHVISLQLKKIEDYNNTEKRISSDSEEAMNNLIKLMELREKHSL